MNPTNDFLGLLKQLLDFPRVIACLLFEFKNKPLQGMAPTSLRIAL